ALYATIIVTSSSFGAATFLLPVYAEELGAYYAALGVIGAAGSATYMVATLIAGALLDRFDRVRLYLVFSFFGAAAVLLFCTAARVVDLVVLRGLLGVVSAMFFVTASTLVADISPREGLTKSLGRYNLSWIAGFIAGPFVGGLIADAYGFPALFIVSAVLILVSSIVIWRSLLSWEGSGQMPSRRWGLDLSALRGLFIVYLTLIPFSVILGIYMSIIPGHLRGLGVTPSLIGLLLLSSCLMSVSLLIFAFTKATSGFFLPLALFGLSGGILTPVIQHIIARRSPRRALGTAMGLHESVYGVGMCIGPLVGGAIAEAFQPATLYLSLAALSLVILPLARGIRG
ncbi:MAG: MFS transporter, partial [Candidatus Bathyarchaeia archaeon]